MNPADTIAAVATAPAPSAIGIVRLSGPDSPRIVRELCPSLVNPEPRRAFVVWVMDPRNGRAVDEAQVLLYRAPHSYTGEDAAEIQCHGSPLILAAVLDLAIKQGARPAFPGEFTRRAFENGRIDLACAEAVADAIAAESSGALQAAQRQLAGELSREIKEIRSSLVEIAADLAASVDFPDEARDEIRGLEQSLETARGRTRRLWKGQAAARLWRDGARVVLVGVPNVGKSSLLNALVGAPRAIVDDAPGTTRDLIEEKTEIGGVAVTLVDTAGLRAPENRVEEEGVARARRAIRSADLVVHVIDASHPIAAEIPGDNIIVVYNKIDLAHPPSRANQQIVAVSARTGEGVDRLREMIATRLGCTSAASEALVTSGRHGQALGDALESLDRARANISERKEELAGLDVDRAIRALGAITGEDATADLLERIFSRFCIGK
jgi:tRNA modification GTPase